jgi:hypothetical protein
MQSKNLAHFVRGGTSQSPSDGRGALPAVIDLAKKTTPCKARITRLLGPATRSLTRRSSLENTVCRLRVTAHNRE